MRQPIWICCDHKIKRPVDASGRMETSHYPAPYFRLEYDLDTPHGAVICIAAVGYYELFLNGRKVGDYVLDPPQTDYIKRIFSVKHDVSEYLVSGRNCIGVVLGNGFYNAGTVTIWNSHMMPWQGLCRFKMEMRDAKDAILAVSGTHWRTTMNGPIIFNEIRNGEHYDARKEMPGWCDVGFDDKDWEPSALINPPGGKVVPQLQPPCRITRKFDSIGVTQLDNNVKVYDFGVGLSGFLTIDLKGPAGATVKLEHAEKIDARGDINCAGIGGLVYEGGFQTDRYILKGDHAGETWNPRFTYHGFRYTRVTCDPGVEILNAQANMLHTDFERAGDFQCSSDILNRLQKCTLQSFLANYVGVPTDCPHREKQSWSGDANLSMETGLYNFDSQSAYSQWLQSFVDEQAECGSVPHVLLTGKIGHGFSWGGPAWDCAFVMMPWTLYLYRGNIAILREHFEHYKRFVDFYAAQIEDTEEGLIRFGLGDWAPPTRDFQIAPIALTSTAFYCHSVELLSRIALLLDKKNDHAYYAAQVADIKARFNLAFYKGNGVYGNGNMTSIACPLYFNICETSEKSKCVERLAELVRACDGKAQFGILGAKFVAHVLGDNGYGDLLFRLFTQEEFPGWTHILKQGATTLWERWNGADSRIHIMYGDISACFYQYFGGIRPNADAPGFERFYLRPLAPKDLDSVNAHYNSPRGTIVSSWRKEGDIFLMHAEIPPGTCANVTLPDGRTFSAPAGIHTWKCPLKT